MAAPKGNVYAQKEQYAYPSYHGSHKSMVMEEETKQLKDKTLTVLKDEFGLYVTKAKYLDNGLADPYRNAWRGYRKELYSKLIAPVKPDEKEKSLVEIEEELQANLEQILKD